MLQTGQVIMAAPAIADWNALIADGFEVNLASGHGNIRNIGMTGNYWEDTRYHDGKVLQRETADKAWVSDGASGIDYEEARLVRVGLAHAIDRQALVDSILDGWGDGPMYFAYQPPRMPTPSRRATPAAMQTPQGVVKVEPVVGHIRSTSTSPKSS